MELEALDHWLLPLPAVIRDLKWGNDMVYSVHGKMFAVLCISGKDSGRVSFKVDTERFLELTDQEGIVPAPYLARVHWILLTQPEDFDQDWLRAQLLRSYELVSSKLPKKLQASLRV